MYQLNRIQRRWIYLEPILIGGALPEQLGLFTQLDTSFRNIMGIIAAKKKVHVLAEIEGIDETLNTITEQQEICQKALN